MSKLAQQLIERERIDRTGFLDLGNCGLTEMPDISDLEWLEALSLSSGWWDWEKEEFIVSENKGGKNQIARFQPENFPKNLQKIFLSGCQISDARFLEKLTGLTMLGLGSSRIGDGRFLEKLTGLTTLYLGNNGIMDGRFLEKLTGLKTLVLYESQISDWRFLEKLTGLTTLDLGNNRIGDGRFLEKLTSLTQLDLTQNQITDLAPLLFLIEKKGLEERVKNKL